MFDETKGKSEVINRRKKGEKKAAKETNNPQSTQHKDK